MTKCQSCGKEEPTQAICDVCGKTYCADHIHRTNHKCFVDPKGVNTGQTRVYVKTYGTGAAKGTNPPKKDYYDNDRFEEKYGYTAKRSPPLWKRILGSPSYVIILICLLIHLLSLFTPFFEFYKMMALVADIGNIINHPWALVTHMFLHSLGDPFHILFNMMALFFFGPYLEKLIGKKSFVLVYLVSGIIAALGFVLFEGNPGNFLVGASGAVYGVLGAIAVLDPNLKVYVYFIPMKIKYMIVIFALISIVFMSGSGSMIAHAAHLSGIIVGLAFGAYYRDKLRKKYRQNNSEY
jgi:Uncharacterized membrane protein (homolog of Drosophila rhomboid)